MPRKAIYITEASGRSLPRGVCFSRFLWSYCLQFVTVHSSKFTFCFFLLRIKTEKAAHRPPILKRRLPLNKSKSGSDHSEPLPYFIRIEASGKDLPQILLAKTPVHPSLRLSTHAKNECFCAHRFSKTQAADATLPFALINPRFVSLWT